MRPAHTNSDSNMTNLSHLNSNRVVNSSPFGRAVFVLGTGQTKMGQNQLRLDRGHTTTATGFTYNSIFLTRHFFQIFHFYFLPIKANLYSLPTDLIPPKA